jgi:phenylacetic acid degradation protein
MIYSFKEFMPVIDASSFIHPLAAITGNVIIGKDCYIGPEQHCVVIGVK